MSENWLEKLRAIYEQRPAVLVVWPPVVWLGLFWLLGFSVGASLVAILARAARP